MVVIVSPAPFASTPTSPSSSMQAQAVLQRRAARAASAAPASRSAASSGRRAAAASSSTSLPSSAISAPSAVERQRIDLDQLGVVIGVDPVEPGQDLGELRRRARQPERHQLRRDLRGRVDAVADVDRDADQRVRSARRQLLDLDAARGRGQDQRPLARGIGQHGGVELALHGDPALDQQPLDRVAADRRGRGSPARPPRASSGVAAGRMPPALPRPPAATCALTTQGRASRPTAAARRGIASTSSPAGTRDAGRGQQRLGGMLLEVHRP